MILAAKIHCSNSPTFVFFRNGHLILKVSRGNLTVFPFLYSLCRGLFSFLSNIYDRTFDENYSIIGAWQCRPEYVTGMNDYMLKATKKKQVNKSHPLLKVPSSSSAAHQWYCCNLLFFLFNKKSSTTFFRF